MQTHTKEEAYNNGLKHGFVSTILIITFAGLLMENESIYQEYSNLKDSISKEMKKNPENRDFSDKRKRFIEISEKNELRAKKETRIKKDIETLLENFDPDGEESTNTIKLDKNRPTAPNSVKKGISGKGPSQ